MSLTITEKYIAENTMYLHNRILNISFYSLIWQGQQIMVGWDENNKYVISVFGILEHNDDDLEYNDDDRDDLKEAISNFILESDLTFDD